MFLGSESFDCGLLFDNAHQFGTGNQCTWLNQQTVRAIFGNGFTIYLLDPGSLWMLANTQNPVRIADSSTPGGTGSIPCNFFQFFNCKVLQSLNFETHSQRADL